jgi:hypothetical protein
MDYINIEYLEYCDQDQLLAQFYSLYRNNYRMSEASKIWIKKFNESETPDDPAFIALDIYKNKILQTYKGLPRKHLTNNEVANIISEVSRLTGVKDQWIRQEIRRAGLSERTKTGMTYLNISYELS